MSSVLPVAMPASQSLLTLGHPLLRQRSQPVSDPRDPHLQRCIDGLLTTMTTAQGVGIAAPQVGWAVRILVVASRPTQRYPHAPTMDPTVLINPRLIALSDETEKGWEGCLSVPGLRGHVPRATQVEVAYLDRWGQAQRQVWQGFVARIVQHEYDHLEGKVFLDRLKGGADLLSEQGYQTLVQPSLGQP